MPIFDHFDFLAPLYDHVIRPVNPEKLISLMGLPVDGYLLDAGGGTGRISQFLTQFASSVIVADISIGMLIQAARKDGLGLVCSPTEKLPFQNETFSRILMVDALHHVQDQKRTAAEFWRLLNPGGRLVIEEMDLSLVGVKLVALAEKMALMRSHFIKPEAIAGLFTATNANIQIERSGHNAWIIVDKVS